MDDQLARAVGPRALALLPIETFEDSSELLNILGDLLPHGGNRGVDRGIRSAG